jgi:hypothetical protein
MHQNFLPLWFTLLMETEQPPETGMLVSPEQILVIQYHAPVCLDFHILYAPSA